MEVFVALDAARPWSPRNERGRASLVGGRGTARGRTIRRGTRPPEGRGVGVEGRAGRTSPEGRATRGGSGGPGEPREGREAERSENTEDGTRDPTATRGRRAHP